jgi:AraC-like DNA-binding protein
MARPSDSPLVQTVWHVQSERAGTFMSEAAANWEMVITKYQGKTTITVRGPETKATPANIPPDAEFFGIVFQLGTFMPRLPALSVLDRNDATLPEASSKSFWLNGSAWEFPAYENADTFVKRLMREELVIREPVVDAALHGHLLQPQLSLRSLQRRFLRVTGLTHNAIFQIERARKAAALLYQGVSILDTVEQTGYADQPHLTRALKHLIGQTPAQILHEIRSQELATPLGGTQLVKADLNSATL